ncbi:MAG: hypothetical protein M3457_09075, partial [Chloroflexota bacterium]|nr:hypothetical protein [Chloroflexota bacterium]
MSLDLVGGKASSVSRLVSLGAPVPAAFALTTRAHDEFSAAHGLPRRVAEITPDDLPRLRDTIMSAPLPASIALDLARGYRTFAERMGADLSLAVRSSGTAEDSAAFSFAGLHDTVLDVRTLPGLERAVRQCWASLWSDRAVAYRLDRGLADEASDIAVVVQQLVRSDVSFIAFTSDPVTLDTGRIVIDAAWGLGESIVSGLVVPDHITIGDDGHMLDYTAGDKHLMVIPGEGPEFGTREVPVPRALRRQPVLTHEQAREIARLARDLSRKLGFETDLEGGIAGGAIHLFQARPITTLETVPIAIERSADFRVGDMLPIAGAFVAPVSKLPRSRT